jgi:hypothetical protein
LLKGFGYSGYFFSGNKKIPIEEFDVSKHQKTGEGRFWAKKGYCNNFAFVA